MQLAGATLTTLKQYARLLKRQLKLILWSQILSPASTNGELSVGAAAGATAGWLLSQPDLIPAQIIGRKLMPQLQQNLKKQGLRLTW